jgi:hypothetical protein
VKGLKSITVQFEIRFIDSEFYGSITLNLRILSMSTESMFSKLISRGSDEPMITLPKLSILVTKIKGGCSSSSSSSISILFSYCYIYSS